MGDEIETLKAEMEQALREIDNEIAAKDARIRELEATVAKAFLKVKEMGDACAKIAKDHAEELREIGNEGGYWDCMRVARKIEGLDLCHADPVPGCETSSAEGPHHSTDGETRK